MKLVGRVLWWNDRDGFGVIEDANGNEYYFDKSATSLKPRQTIKRNIVVEFSLNAKIQDAPCAATVAIPKINKRRTLETRFQRQLEKAAVA